LPVLFEKQRLEEQGGLVKTKGVDDLMGNVTAFMYSDLKEGLSSIKDPDVQTRTLGQARMVLGSVNTMMPDPQAPNSMLPPPLDSIWLALPQGNRPQVETVRAMVTHDAERGIRPAEAMAKLLVTPEKFAVIRHATEGKKVSGPMVIEGCPELYGIIDASTLACAVLMGHTLEEGDFTSCGLRDTTMSIVGCWRRVKVLCLANNDKLSDISAIAHCPILASLDCTKCVRINDLTPLSTLKYLTKIRVAHGIGLVHGNMLPMSRSLQELYLPHCTKLLDLSNLAYCPNLTTLSVGCCKKLSDLSAVQYLRRLKEVSLGSCTAIRPVDLQYFNVNALVDVDLQHVNNLTCESVLALAREMDPMPYVVWPDKKKFETFCKEQEFQKNDAMLLWRLTRGAREAARRKLELQLTGFDDKQLSHAIAVAEAYDLDAKMIKRGYRRYEQLMRGATRSQWIMGFRRLGYTDAAEDCFDYVNSAYEQWVIIEDVVRQLGNGGPAALEEMEEFQAWAVQIGGSLSGFLEKLGDGEVLTDPEVFASRLAEMGWSKPNGKEVFTALTCKTGTLTPQAMACSNLFLAARQQLQVFDFSKFLFHKFVNPTKAFKQMEELAGERLDGVHGVDTFESVAAQCGWAQPQAARTVYKWMEKHGDVIKLPAFEYLLNIQPRQVLRDIDEFVRFCIENHKTMEKVFDMLAVEVYELRKEKMKRDMLRAATRASREKEREERYKELQAIRGVVEVKEIAQGDDEDAVAGSLWTCLRAKDDLRQQEFNLDEEVTWFFFSELKQVFGTLNYPGTLDLQSLFNFCDTEHSNMLQRDTWCALAAFNPFAALQATAKGSRFLLKFPGTLQEAFVSLREQAQITSRRKSNLKTAAGMVLMGARSKSVVATDTEETKDRKGKSKSRRTSIKFE
jgi:hypothetical protein